MKPLVQCQSCNLRRLCLPVMLAEAEIDHLDGMLKRNTVLQPGEFLYRAGDPFRNLYALRSGCIKNTLTAEDGSEQIISFHLPGEICGLDAVGNESCATSAIAVETTHLCTLPFEDLESIAQEVPGLQRQVMGILSQGIRKEQEQSLLLGKRTAEERVAAFLLNLCQRRLRRQLDARTFTLPMQMKDVSNHLGLAQETLSRLLKRLGERGLVKTSRRRIELLDLDALAALAGSHCDRETILTLN